MQGLRPTNQLQTAAGRAGVEERHGGAVIHAWPVHECYRPAARRLDPIDSKLDPRSRRNTGSAPSTGTGRGGGRDGIGRTVALPQKKEDKLWIWLAFDRAGRRLVDWECGDRDAVTLNRLLKRLKRWNVMLYGTDEFGPYDSRLPVGRHYMGKDQTVAVERVNSRLRHWFARFRRRTCVVSKTMAMVDATLALFAAYHINGTGPKLTSPLEG
jgi:insertion element IS1 protein InsB